MSVETATKPVITAEAQAAPVDTRTASLRAIYIIWYRDILRYWPVDDLLILQRSPRIRQPEEQIT